MAQFLRPSSDVTVGSWTTTPLWDKIDESTFSDTDFIESNNNINETVEVGLSAGSTPQAGTVTIRYRYAKSATSGNARTIQVQIVEGTTVIASGTTQTPTATTYTADSFTLTSPQIASITDWSNLRLRFIAGGTTGGSGANRRSVRISWAEVETPNAIVPVTRSLAATIAVKTTNTRAVAATIATRTTETRVVGATIATSVAGGAGGDPPAFLWEANNATLGTSITITRGTVANGDILVATVASDATTDLGPPSGWTPCYAEIDNSSSAVRSWYKIITDAAGEATTYQFTATVSDDLVGTIVAYSGVDTTTPLDVTPTSHVNAVDTATITGPSITTVTNNCRIIWFGINNSTSYTITEPSGTTSRFKALSGMRLTVADYVQATAGATGDKIGTPETGRENVGGQIALRPLASSGLKRTLGASIAVQTTNMRSLGATISVSAITTNTRSVGATISVGNLVGVIDSSGNRVVTSASDPVVATTFENVGTARSVAATIAVQTLGNTRSLAASIAVQTTLTRAVATTIAVQTINLRSVAATIAAQTTNVRPLTTSIAVSTSANTRTLSESIAVSTQNTRSVGASIAVTTTNVRSVATTISVSVSQAGLTRTLGASIAVATTNSRSLGGTIAVSVSGITRTLPTSIAVSTTGTRSVANSIATQTTNMRSVGPTIAVSTLGLTRSVGASIAVRTTLTRSLAASISVRTTNTRSVAATISISGGTVRGVATTIAVRATQTRSLATTIAIGGNVTRTLSATIAVSTQHVRSVGTSIATRVSQTRSLGTSLSISTTTVRSLAVSIATSAGLVRSVGATVAVSTTQTRSLGVTISVVIGGSAVIGGLMRVEGSADLGITRSIDDVVLSATKSIVTDNVFVAGKYSDDQVISAQKVDTDTDIALQRSAPTVTLTASRSFNQTPIGTITRVAEELEG